MTAKDLRAKFEKDLEELQKNCPHKSSTEMVYSYAPGHFTGMVTVCDTCEYIISKKEPNQSIKDLPRKDEGLRFC